MDCGKQNLFFAIIFFEDHIQFFSVTAVPPSFQILISLCSIPGFPFCRVYFTKAYRSKLELA